VTAGDVELRSLAEAVDTAQQVIDDYVGAGAVAWAENLYVVRSWSSDLARARAPWS
jgi:hypothetical protein